MWTYEVEPLGTARGYERDERDPQIDDSEIGLDLSEEDFARVSYQDLPSIVELEEYRIRFFENDTVRGMFRLSAYQGRWTVPHRQLLTRMHQHRTGVHRLQYTCRVVHDDGFSYLEYAMDSFRVHMGPLQKKAAQQLVFVFDADGGCTGYCRATDLHVVCKAFEEVCVPRRRGKR